MATAAVIVAAGRGVRAGAGRPKQWRSVAGRSVAAWTLEAFRHAPEIGRIVLVLHPDDMGLAAGYDALPDVTCVAGGADRQASVRAGLEALDADPPDHVLVHDVARPLVSASLIARVIAALETSPAAAPALSVSDALWRGAEGQVQDVADRTGLYRAQTPQGFYFALLLDAHRAHPGGAADDVAVIRADGVDVAIVQGDEDNLKITGPEDFARAERLLRGRMDIRVGNGFDVHAFGPGDQVVLCGVAVPHDRALKGHSDADVGMHALTDAIYGALGQGDIGQHFPPSQAEWGGADSRIFLDHAVALARDAGMRVGNADVTLICEAPKIGPHAAAMRARLAEIIEVDVTRVSVKATTSEKLGFTGRGEGIAAMATVTLVGA